MRCAVAAAVSGANGARQPLRGRAVQSRVCGELRLEEGERGHGASSYRSAADEGSTQSMTNRRARLTASFPPSGHGANSAPDAPAHEALACLAKNDLPLTRETENVLHLARITALAWAVALPTTEDGARRLRSFLGTRENRLQSATVLACRHREDLYRTLREFVPAWAFVLDDMQAARLGGRPDPYRFHRMMSPAEWAEYLAAGTPPPAVAAVALADVVTT